MRPETSSSSAFSSPSPPASPLTAGKSMEDVWQGINLGSLRHPALPPSLADFSARSSSVFHFGILSAGGGGGNPPAPISPHPLLSPGFSNFSTSFANRNSNPPLVFPSHAKRSRADGGGGKGEQWQKRRMKNRESAARSRARKQAYTQELENEVDRLKMENAKLRSKLNKDEYVAGVGGQLHKKTTLCRTLTAPF